MSEQIVEIELPNGAVALARVNSIGTGGAEKTASFGKLDFDEVGKILEGLAQAVHTSLAAAAPQKVSVELGLELAMKSGKLSGLLVEGEGKGSLAVTLEWDSRPNA